MKKSQIAIWMLLLFSMTIIIGACGDDDDDDNDSTTDDDETDDDSTVDDDGTDDDDNDDSSDDDDDDNDDNDDDSAAANVVEVTTEGEPGDYTFTVKLETDDTGCEQYADWWEVLSEAGELIYRRILTHSHPDEQPFARSGGPVDIQADTTVIVRAHMNTTGYGGAAMRGSVTAGFADAPDITADFAPDVETQDPQPEDCLF